MGDAAPGWYEDDEDRRLARWWDGRSWTRHTLVIDDQPAGVEPAPPSAATRFPVPPPPDEWLDDPSFAEGAEPVEYGYEDEAYDTEAFDDAYADEYRWTDEPEQPATGATFRAWPTFDDPDDGGWRRLDPADDRQFRPPHAPRRGRSRHDDELPTLGERVRELPTWLRVVAPMVAVLVALGAVASAGALLSDDGGGDNLDTEARDEDVTDPARLREAADAALDAAGVSWFTRQGFLASIPPTCSAAQEDDAQRVADRIILLGYDDPTVGHLVDGLEAGTLEYCPEDVAEHPTFFEDVFLATGAEAAATSTTTTSPEVTVPPTTATTTRPTTPTTRKATATTKPAPTTTVPPPTTTVPATTTTTTAAPTTTACPGVPCE